MVSNNAVTLASHTSWLNLHRQNFSSISAFLRCIWEKAWRWTLSIASDCFSRADRLMHRVLGSIHLNYWCRNICLYLVVLNTKIVKFIPRIREITLVFARRNHALTLSSCSLSTLLLILLGPYNIKQVWEALAEPGNTIALIPKGKLGRPAVYANRILLDASRLLLRVWPITIFIFWVVAHKLVLHLQRVKHFRLTTACKFWIVESISFSLAAISSFNWLIRSSIVTTGYQYKIETYISLSRHLSCLPFR